MDKDKIYNDNYEDIERYVSNYVYKHYYVKGHYIECEDVIQNIHLQIIKTFRRKTIDEEQMFGLVKKICYGRIGVAVIKTTKTLDVLHTKHFKVGVVENLKAKNLTPLKEAIQNEEKISSFWLPAIYKMSNKEKKIFIEQFKEKPDLRVSDKKEYDNDYERAKRKVRKYCDKKNLSEYF